MLIDRGGRISVKIKAVRWGTRDREGGVWEYEGRQGTKGTLALWKGI